MKKIITLLAFWPILSFAQITDTTYVLTSIPTADLHNVLVENFSGESCSNAPAVNTLLDSIESAYATGRLNIIDLFAYGWPQTMPPPGSSHDLRDSMATHIANQIFPAFPGLASAGIDRDGNCTSFIITGMGSEIVSRMLITDSVNLSVSGYYSSVTNKVNVAAQVIYLQPMTTKQNLSVVLIEDSIIDHQDSFTEVVPNYRFDNVFRKMISSGPYGDTVLPGMTAKEAGRVYSCTYSFTPGALWLLNHCRIIAFINSASSDNPTILQSSQSAINVHPTAINQISANGLLRIFPNPVKNNLVLESACASNYRIITITGSTVASGNLYSGIDNISLASLTPGSYLLIQTKDDSETIYKIIKD